MEKSYCTLRNFLSPSSCKPDDIESESSKRNSQDSSVSEEFFGGTVEETREFIAKKAIAHQQDRISSRDLCPRCFLTNLFCICDHTQRVYRQINEAPLSLLPVKIHLFTHFKEWGRASNTGKLLQIGIPSRTSIRIYGIKEDEDALISELLANNGIVLYPSKDALSISEFLPTFREIQELSTRNQSTVPQQENVINDDNHIQNPSKLFHLCVIDSTWLQSRAMEKIFPASIPRVHINEYVLQPSKFLNRKQSRNKTKISTIESIVLTLGALNVNPEVLDIFLKSLEYAVDSLLRQGGRATAYGNNVQPQFKSDMNTLIKSNESKEPERGPYIKPTITKPTHCLHCYHSIHDTTKIVNFKNCGVRTRKRDLANPVIEKEKAYIESVEKIMNESLLRQDELFQMNSQLTLDIWDQNRERMKEILLFAPTYRVWKCSICNQFFPCPDQSV